MTFTDEASTVSVNTSSSSLVLRLRVKLSSLGITLSGMYTATDTASASEVALAGFPLVSSITVESTLRNVVEGPVAKLSLLLMAFESSSSNIMVTM